MFGSFCRGRPDSRGSQQLSKHVNEYIYCLPIDTHNRFELLSFSDFTTNWRKRGSFLQMKCKMSCIWDKKPSVNDEGIQLKSLLEGKTNVKKKKKSKFFVLFSAFLTNSMTCRILNKKKKSANVKHHTSKM